MISICCSFRPTLSPNWWLKTEPASRCSRSIPEVLHSVAARHESPEMPRGCTARPRPYTEKLGIWGRIRNDPNMFRGFFPGGRFSNAPPKISPRFPHLRREIQTEPSAVSSNISPEGFQLTIESFHWIRSGCLPHPGSQKFGGMKFPPTWGDDMFWRHNFGCGIPFSTFCQNVILP